jgi:hypothetical protein
VHNDKRTHVRKGATEPGQDGPGPPGLAHPGVGWPPFLQREDLSTLSMWRRRHSQGESHSPERSSTG